MNVTGFLQCLSGKGFQTGNLVAYYDFSQTDGGVIFNQLYPTGLAYSGSYANLAYTPGIIVGNQPSVGGQFSTQIGGYLDLRNLHCLFDFDFSGCQNTGLVQATILLTSKGSDSDSGGFVLGINSSNRLFYENNGLVYTLNEELRDKNVISLSIAQGKYVTLGLFDFENNTYLSENFANPLNKGLSELYLISYPTGDHSVYSGAMGSLNHFALLNDSLLDKGAVSNCLFCTGVSYAPQLTSGTLISISGVIFQNIYQSGITGFQTLTGTVLKEGGGIVSVVYSSGLSGVYVAGTQTVAVTTTGSGVVFQSYNPQIQYNEPEILNYANFEAIFNADLSGNNIEFYLYPTFQIYKNLPITNNRLPYAPDSMYSNIYINGLLETNGVDYFIVENEVVILGDASLVNTMSVSYSSLPTTVINSTGQTIFNGFSGQDVYLNGQKLASGGSFILSGSAIVINSGVTASGDEITFLPVEGLPTKRFTGITSSTKILSGISGFSEQIWMNGVLQQKNNDYYLGQQCSENYYFFSPNNPFLIYNNDGYYLIKSPYSSIIGGFGGDIIEDFDGNPIVGV